MAQWDVTTAEGRDALERFLMERMGWWREDLLSLPCYMREDGRTVTEGWIYTGDGAAELKRWAAEKYWWTIETVVSKDFARSVVLHADPAYPRQITEASCEEYAVALALARALEEMEQLGTVWRGPQY